MINTTKKRLLTVSISAALSMIMASQVFAAKVPDGVQLADKQVLVRNNGSEPQSLDPHKIEGVPESHLARDLFEGVVIVGPNGEILPGSATNWENKDFTVWTFHMRKDAKWSNGDPVTAHDFVYSWQRLADPNTASPYESYLQYAHITNIDDIISGKKKPDALGVKALDDYTLQLTLSEAVPYLPRLLAHSSMSPVHKATVEKYGEKWTQSQNFVGNGAYKLKNWVVNERIVMERSPTYWDNKNTVIDQVTFLPISSEVTDVNRYRSGEIDMTYTNLPIELFQKLKKEIPNELHINPQLCTYYYEINNEKPPFNDPRVRTALKLAMDRDIVTNKVKAQGDIPASGYTPPVTDGMKEMKPVWFTGWSQEQRNQEAKKLLAEAGYNKDNPLKFNLLYNTSDLHKKIAIAVASIWKKNLGADVRLENQEWKTFLDTRHQGNYDVARAGWCADYNEPSSFLNSMLSYSSNNTAHYKSDEFDKLMKQSLKVATDDERAAVYQQAEAQLDKDSAIVPLYYYVNTRLVKPYVGGYTGKDPLDNLHTKDFYIIKH
ncbi:oligopeptide ABC transporter substrate-binding protein OppA [Photorhabdus laumondii subsp. laumondii]|uniref:Periplasmic oligopeptide-binding protein OppA n=2 Tax=Photorhabdus laumondii subsp. laumondii TaxID=141679 RepID=Q7N461_PHOLL|nr:MULTISPECIES: oligopeptide ABC transporter substrate-binding protein OppA [Photorhabdus]AWK42241.1 oligopeptide ABC transporter substrate-binding protein OppA [Photorhabdus laumondii subsp. laumondii]AXG43091.1 oligopeptide ABC transporter substrate-binding protein OppA [Photorhabdus laumondii subsp. laumondii]AXG47562.1 oligopeptide ABC transporter substrate-binding protein OppA [Photorhabdus laumondii subsp. laumondii]KTL59801.1 peptide ABC transporter substrate-binding protein [Photorhabd